MNNLELPHSKLLYFVGELWKQKAITDTEKANLKEIIIGDEPKIFEFLEEYENDSNEERFKENIIRLVRPEEDPMVIKGMKDHSPPEQDDVKNLSSPLGRVLLDRKKTHHTNDNHAQLKNALKPTGDE